MKKKLLPLALLFTFCKMYSQVGVNTTTPAATLDITAQNATGASTNVDGVLITRVDRQRAQSMTGVPTSTLVYVNSIATGTQTGAAVNINAVGYYYYDGTAWVKLHNPTNSTAANIYNADGTLTGNRTVSQAGNTLAFTGTATNAFSVDNTTFSVDAANDRVGVGTTTPDTRLTVSTPDNSFGLNHTNGTINLKTFIGGGSGYLGTTTANDFKLMTNNTARVTVTSGGDIGVNNAIPASNLDITAKNATGTSTTVEGVLIIRVDRQRAQSMTGIPVSTLVYVNSVATGTQTGTAININAVGYYYYDGTAWVKLHNPTNAIAANIYNSDGSLTGNRTVSQAGNTLAFTGTATNTFSVDNTTFSVDAANNRVGVGTTAPDTKLTIVTPDNSYGLNHSNSTINLKTFIGGGAGYLGTTTANDFKLMTNNAARVTITSAGNVGMGISAPTENLDIAGGVRIRGAQEVSANSDDLILIIQPDGKVKKSKALRLSNQAVFPQTSQNVKWNSTPEYTGTYISLPPGKWYLNTTILLDANGMISNGVSGWVQASISDSNSSFSFSNDIIGSHFVSGAITGPAYYGMLQGGLVVNNTTTQNKTYYFWKYNVLSFGANTNWDFKNFARGVAGEDQLIAIPME